MDEDEKSAVWGRLAHYGVRPPEPKATTEDEP